MNKRHYRKKSSWHFLCAFVFQSTKYFSTPEKRVIDTANGRFVFFLQRNTPHRICGKKKKKETLPEKELLTQLMFVFSFFLNEILLNTYVERRRRRNIARERVIDTANVRFVSDAARSHSALTNTNVVAPRFSPHNNSEESWVSISPNSFLDGNGHTIQCDTHMGAWDTPDTEWCLPFP